ERVRPANGHASGDIADETDPAGSRGSTGEARKTETEGGCPTTAERWFPVCYRREQQRAGFDRDSLARLIHEGILNQLPCGLRYARQRSETLLDGRQPEPISQPARKTSTPPT